VSIYVNKDNGFKQAETLSRECPHCGAHAQLLPVATPSYEALMNARPRHVGIAYRCAACNEPRFVRATVRTFEADRVELSANLLEIERPKERFQFSYLPDDVETLFREALDCYTAGCHNAFASMCRRAFEAAVAADGAAGQRLRELCRDVAQIADLSAATQHTIESVLFAASGPPPQIGADQAAVLIEVVKDMLYQHYVRVSKLRAAMKVRRYFAGEAAQKVTSIERRPRRESA
jgi:hypothetical protein